MQKDLKIGLALGLAIAAAAILWLSTRPSLTTKARMLERHSITQTPYVSPQQNNTSATATETTAPKPEPKIINPVTKTTKFHIVRKGDTLSKISSIHYGTPNDWQKILNANRNIIKNANKLTLGTKLTIPQ